MGLQELEGLMVAFVALVIGLIAGGAIGFLIGVQLFAKFLVNSLAKLSLVEWRKLQIKVERKRLERAR
jgi:hypothetical protein